MLPKELDDIFEEYTEDDYNLFIAKADYSGDTLLLEVILNVDNINDKGEKNQRWLIKTSGHRKNHIYFGFSDYIKIQNGHPLIWEFTDTQCQLYFNGTCNEPEKVFYDLYSTHKQVFGNYQCFNISLFEDTINFKPFQYSNGLLTEGSKKLMSQYGECLERNGLNYSIVNERKPKYWNGEKYIPEKENLKILFIGLSYVIAEDFHFMKQEENSR